MSIVCCLQLQLDGPGCRIKHRVHFNQGSVKYTPRIGSQLEICRHPQTQPGKISFRSHQLNFHQRFIAKTQERFFGVGKVARIKKTLGNHPVNLSFNGVVSKQNLDFPPGGFRFLKTSRRGFVLR